MYLFCVHIHAIECMWRSEENFKESVHSYYVDTWHGAQSLRFGIVCLDPESDDSVQVSFLYIWICKFPSNVCWLCSLFSNLIFGNMFQKRTKQKQVVVGVCSLSHSLILFHRSMCQLCVSTMLFLWWCLCHITGNEEEGYLLRRFYCSQLLGLYGVFCVSIQILRFNIAHGYFKIKYCSWIFILMPKVYFSKSVCITT